MRDIYWWSLVTAVGGLFQHYLGGIDFYLPALVLCFQKKRYFLALFLGNIWILIQEGSGDIPFGGIALWYISVTFFYFWLKQFLAANNLIFVSILSFFSSILYYISILIITSLEDIVVNKNLILSYCIKQVFIFPILWLMYTILYQRYVSIKEDLV